MEKLVKSHCPYISFIDNYDFFGWVPTIRGALSFGVFDDAKSIWGDVDKYALEYKRYNNNNTIRYLVASSLMTFADRKGGRKYHRTFRFIFKGSINDDEKQKKFIEDFKGKDKPDEELFRQKEILIGKLYIVVNHSNKITKPINDILDTLSKFSKKKKKEYHRESSEDQGKNLNDQEENLNDQEESLNDQEENLNDQEEKKKKEWDEIENKIKCFEEIIDENNPMYAFNVALSRDGLLFLKDVSNDKFRIKKVEDFTKHTQYYRLINTAIYFIKFLFHKNYHHNEANDTFLPVSNLERVKPESTLDKVNKEQIEAFLSPVIKVKRNINTDYILCDPKGILLYAQSFIMILKNNKFISEKDAKIHEEFIDKQSKEFDVFQSDFNMTRNSFLSQNNLLARFTACFAFLLAAKQSFDLLFLNKLFCLNAIEEFFLRLLVVCSSLGLGAFVHIFVVKRAIAKGKFIKKEKPKNILNIDSNLKRGKLSICYIIRLWWIGKKLSIREINFFWIKLALLIISLPLVLAFSYKLYHCLMSFFPK